MNDDGGELKEKRLCINTLSTISVVVLSCQAQTRPPRGAL